MRASLESLTAKLPQFEERISDQSLRTDFRKFTEFHTSFSEIYAQYMAYCLISVGIDPNNHSQFSSVSEEIKSRTYFPTKQECKTFQREIHAFTKRVDTIAKELDVISNSFRAQEGSSLVGEFLGELLSRCQSNAGLFARNATAVGCEPPPGSQVVNGKTIIPTP